MQHALVLLFFLFWQKQVQDLYCLTFTLTGAHPPDLSLIVRGRPDGANYLYSLLTGKDQNTSEILESVLTHAKYSLKPDIKISLHR